MIAGAPGIGKTEALYHFKSSARCTIIHVAVAGEASPWSLAFGLMRALDMGQAEPPPSGR